MELTVTGSSSKGNGYIFQNAEEALIIEAGCPVGDYLEALGFNTAKVAACLVTHEHLDHAKNVNRLQGYGVRCYCSQGTSDGLRNLLFPVDIIQAGKKFKVGGFTILPFDTKHNSNEPLGFLIFHREMGTTLFAIDTCYLAHKFEGLHNILIECNYIDELLEKNIQEGNVHPKVRTHVLTGHMSLQTCIQALQANDLTSVNNIILLHLSSENSDAQRFQNEVQLATGKQVHVARKGLKIRFDKTPF